MKLFTEGFKKYAKIIEKFSSNEEQKSRSIYLNFEDSCGYLINPNFAGKFKFTFEGEPIDNFFVDMTKFLTICEAYDFFEIDENLEFVNNEDKFKLMSYNETFDLIDFDLTDYTMTTIASDTFSVLKSANSFVGQADLDQNFAGILLQGDKVVSGDRNKIFEGTQSVTFPTIKFPEYIVKLIAAAESFGVNIYHKEDKNSVILSFNNGDFLVVSPTVSNLAAFPIDDDMWEESYNHPLSFTVNRVALNEQMDFFKVFTASISTDPIDLIIESETTLSIQAKGSEFAIRSIPISNCSPELVGETIPAVRKIIAKALEVIPEEDIKIQFNPEQTHPRLINIAGTATNKVHNIHVVSVLLLED